MASLRRRFTNPNGEFKIEPIMIIIKNASSYLLHIEKLIANARRRRSHTWDALPPVAAVGYCAGRGGLLNPRIGAWLRF